MLLNHLKMRSPVLILFSLAVVAVVSPITDVKSYECERPCVRLYDPVCVYDSVDHCLQEFTNLCYLDIAECKQPYSK